MYGTIQDWEDDRRTREYREYWQDQLEPPTVELDMAAKVSSRVAKANEDTCVLLERNYAGLRVEVGYHHTLGATLLVQVGEDVPYVCEIPGDKALDAFNHPFLYVPEDVTV